MFKNHDILDNFNIMGSDNMTPIIEKENQYNNPYATTLWKNKEENKMTVNKFQTDSKENIKKTLSIKRKIQIEPLLLSNIIKKEQINFNNKRKSTRSFILDLEESETHDLNSISSHSDSLQNFDNLLNKKRKYATRLITTRFCLQYH